MQEKELSPYGFPEGLAARARRRKSLFPNICSGKSGAFLLQRVNDKKVLQDKKQAKNIAHLLKAKK